MKKNLGFLGILLIVSFVCANAVSIPVLLVHSSFDLQSWLGWTLFFFVIFLLAGNVLFVNKIFTGKFGEVVFFLSTTLLISSTISFVLYCVFVKAKLDFSKLSWYEYLDEVVKFDVIFYGIDVLVFVGIIVIYATLINRKFLEFFKKSSFNAHGKLKQVEANLENSRWMTTAEKEKLFPTYKYSALKDVKKDGIPIAAKLINKDQDMSVTFSSPCHALVIGSTGSGKTTTFVSPMIQLIGATKAGSSMIVTDPKGELFSMHSQYLSERGYDVKVIDLRDTYASDRWNPLDSIWDSYQKYLNAYKAALAHVGDVSKFDLKIVGKAEDFANVDKWYEFEGKAYSKYEQLVQAIKIYKKKIYDEVYEDLNDLVSVLIPVENEKDPMWEKGARAITLAVLLAMLEDANDPRLGMTKEKFNFFNMTKILQNSNKDYQDLRNYFVGRSPLSKASSLAKQVCDAATQTRASYMSIVYEKLTMFNDAGICALTGASDFNSEGIAYKPTALFLKIPDEKDTRHNLAAIFILNIYKTLIKIASAKESLSLDRNVFFIMDEFGNMPKIEKFDKFITVGRSRKIWFTMIVQSYAQLNNVYGETVADIVKGNCGIKMFIGSNDMGTCKEYSELCGNITILTSSASYNGTMESSTSTQTQTRPLIYPSELQRLNHPGDIGHSIIVTFGNYPLKTYFSPSFKVKLYKFGKLEMDSEEKFFDENAIFYDIKKRSEVLEEERQKNEQASATQENVNNQSNQASTSQRASAQESTTQETTTQNNTSQDNEENNAENSGSSAAEMAEETARVESIITAYAEFIETHKGASLNDFYKFMASSEEEEAQGENK